MKEKIKLIVLIIIFIVVLVIANNLLNNSGTTQNNNEDNEIANTENVEEKVTTSVISSYNANNAGTFYTEPQDSGEVLEVAEENFEQEVLKSDKTVLIDFYADWCNPCKVLSPIVEDVAKENPDIKLVKIDVDTNENLAYEYRAYSIPTLVVIKNGVEVNRSVGVIPKEDILELIK